MNHLYLLIQLYKQAKQLQITHLHLIVIAAMAANYSFLSSYPVLSLFLLNVLLILVAPPSFALFQTSSGPQGLLSVQEGSAVYVAITQLLAVIDTSKWYDSGFAFANVQLINGKRIAIRYARWTQFCTVGTWEGARGDLVWEDLRTTIPYIRPYLLQGSSWAAISNGYAWLDYYTHPLPPRLPASIVMNIASNTNAPKARYTSRRSTDATAMNVSYNYPNENSHDNSFTSSTVSVLSNMTNSTAEPPSSSSSRVLVPTVPRYSPLDKTRFVDCPVQPLILLSHLNGIWDVLKTGEYLTSANRRIQLAMRRDCNLVLTDTLNNRLLWSSKTTGRGNGCFLRLQTEANLVIYNRNGDPLWAINQGCGAVCEKFSALVIEDDGNMVVYRSQNNKLNPVWATNTKV